MAHFKDGRKPLTQDASVGVPRGLRCSPDHILDGNDPVCYDGTFTKPLWVYWWPEAGVQSIDFFLNGEFYRTERKAPYELDAGAAFDAGGAFGG